MAGCIVLTKGKDILYHIGNPENEISMIDLAKLVEKVCGKRHSGISGKTYSLQTRTKRRCPSVDKIKNELDYTLDIDLEESLSRIYSWAQKNYQKDFTKSSIK